MMIFMLIPFIIISFGLSVLFRNESAGKSHRKNITRGFKKYLTSSSKEEIFKSKIDFLTGKIFRLAAKLHYRRL